MRTVSKVSMSVRFSAQATANGAAPSSTRITTTAAGEKIGGAGGRVAVAGLAFPCTDATVGGETVKAATTVRGFR
jgi:hypothetical protein